VRYGRGLIHRTHRFGADYDIALPWPLTAQNQAEAGHFLLRRAIGGDHHVSHCRRFWVIHSGQGTRARGSGRDWLVDGYCVALLGKLAIPRLVCRAVSSVPALDAQARADWRGKGRHMGAEETRRGRVERGEQSREAKRRRGEEAKRRRGEEARRSHSWKLLHPVDWPSD